jgi:hypothetical protein
MKRFIGLGLICLVAACSDSTSASNVNMGPPAGSPKAQYVVSKLIAPTSRLTYGYPLLGGDKLFNQLGNIIAALNANKIDTQMSIDKAMAGGDIIILIDETSIDPAFKSDQAAASTVYVGNTTPVGMDMGNAPPDLTGNGMFTINSKVGMGSFLGRIANGTFNSNSPFTAKVPVTVTITFPLAGSSPLQLSVSAAHLQYTRVGDGLMTGQINGAMKKDDVTNTIVPTVATLVDQRVVAAPTDPQNQQTLMLFDTGGTADPADGCPNSCFNPPGTLRSDMTPAPMCAVKMDGRVDLCEVSTNSIIKGVLNPDVQLYQNGVYAPNPANDMKDSLSLGVGFEAVKATFQ